MGSNCTGSDPLHSSPFDTPLAEQISLRSFVGKARRGFQPTLYNFWRNSGATTFFIYCYSYFQLIEPQIFVGAKASLCP
ncbi:hypothetical protein SAMD00079811_08910 [Scytonema sp. HK-05]|nr:hypothetical protein SAMD00079811_08910 [Scytonema sp. HK-05]